MKNIGYSFLPNFDKINFNSSRQGILFDQLVAQNLITGEEWIRDAKNAPSSNHWIGMKVKNNSFKAAFVDSIVPDLLKEGAIYDSLDTIAEGIVARSQSNGGSTTYVDTGLAVTGGYAVAIAGSPEETYGNLDEDIVKDYIERNYDSYLKGSGHYLGTWLDGGTWYLDVSEVLIGKDKKIEALKLAKDRGEKAIYDLYNGETIYTDQLDELLKENEPISNEESGINKEEDFISLSNKLFDRVG